MIRGGKYTDTGLHKGWGQMARGRMLNHKITENELVAGLSNDTSRLGFTWLISFCDVEGRVHGNPALVRAKLFPLRDDMTNDEMASYIREWAEAGLIEWYEDDTGRLWIQFPGFAKNQKGLDRRKEPASEIPPPTAEGKEKVRTRYVLGTYQVQHKRTEEKRTEENDDDDARARARRFAEIAREYELVTGTLASDRAREEIAELADSDVSIELIRECRQLVQERRDNGQRINAPWAYLLSVIRDRKRGNGHPRASPRGEVARQALEAFLAAEEIHEQD